MQLTIVGKFKTGTIEDGPIGAGFDLSDENTKVSWAKNASQLVKDLDAGLKTDLLICGCEVNIDELKSSLLALGIPAPKIIQPTNQSDLGSANRVGEEINQMASSLVGTRLVSDNDPSAWLGNEDNPLRLGQSLCDMERSLILQTLTHCGGNRTYAADILGISSRTLRSKLQQYSAEGCSVKAAPQRQSSIATHAPVSTLLS